MSMFVSGSLCSFSSLGVVSYLAGTCCWILRFKVLGDTGVGSSGVWVGMWVYVLGSRYEVMFSGYFVMIETSHLVVATFTAR